ncbi:MAG: hypothetical protein DRO40_03335 [Thermoprotei archaeon]|nr:MAG: hypothetical protein DRO40_03335 [Thermoprotei archaeon]
MLKKKALATGILISFITVFISWYPLIALLFLTNDIWYIVPMFIISSLVSSILTLLLHNYVVKVHIINILFALVTIILYIITFFFNQIYLWIILLGLLVSLSGYLGRAYNTIISSSYGFPKTLKSKILDKIISRSWIFGSIGCVVMTLLAINTGTVYTIGILIALSTISLASSLLFRPYVSERNIVDVNTVEHNELYRVLLAYTAMVVFGLNILYPYIPALLALELNKTLLEIGIFYASIIVLSRFLSSLAQLIVALKGPVTSFFIRSLISALMLLTASASEHPLFTIVCVGAVLVISPFHSIAYSVFAKVLGVKKIIRAEILYTVITILTVYIGYRLWNMDRRLLLIIPSFILFFTISFIGRLKKYEKTVLEEVTK